MSGYTPLFNSLTKGTLCGKWPDIGLWPIILSLSDKNGIVDATPAYISSITGLPIDDVIACMGRFCQPDPYSRSSDAGGARLQLVDAHRDWGWKIINHGKYREKARKSSYDSERTASGRDAERKRKSRDVPTCPDVSRLLPLSDSDSDSGKRERRATRLPADFALTPERRLVAEAETLPAERTFEKFCDYWRGIPGAKGRKLDWDATWRNWCRNDRDAKPVQLRQARGLVL